MDCPSSDSLMDSSLAMPSSLLTWWWRNLPANDAGALPLKGGDGVVERNLSLRLARDDDDPFNDDVAPPPDAAVMTPCGGESLLLLTLPRHEKAPLLLLLLWLQCQAANSSVTKQKHEENL